MMLHKTSLAEFCDSMDKEFLQLANEAERKRKFNFFLSKGTTLKRKTDPNSCGFTTTKVFISDLVFLLSILWFSACETFWNSNPESWAYSVWDSSCLFQLFSFALVKHWLWMFVSHWDCIWMAVSMWIAGCI